MNDPERVNLIHLGPLTIGLVKRERPEWPQVDVKPLFDAFVNSLGIPQLVEWLNAKLERISHRLR